ncbi:LicD family protein [Eubacterium sp.]|uniref:LicD family protein n=1 Tax=Eubacterium sp. TaxID=142586 RepID=UPI0025E735CB|nr:LicD family protein [Eubacterium sp.]MCR5629814.1 LicD family protein [Eubacterium sp.]
MKKKMNINEVREVQIGILDYFDKFCEDNNLRYSLTGGTLLGAIRHKGFIPWDDDIDVMMPRPDYQKLIAKAVEFDDDKFVLKIPTDKRNHYYPYPYIKACDVSTILIEKLQNDTIKYNIYIDIFPIDGLPEKNIKKYYKKTTRLCLFYFALSCSYYKKNQGIIKKIVWKMFYLLSKFIKPYKVAKIIEKRVLKYDFDKSEQVGDVVSGYGLKEVNKCKKYDSYIEFEGKKYHAIDSYDEFLSNVYGDYMKLPPEKDRVRRHDYDAYRIK